MSTALSLAPRPVAPPSIRAALARHDLHGHVVQTDAHAVHVIDVGEGPVLLFLHGAPVWSYTWRHVIAGLRDQFRCVAIDVPGFGGSPAPDQPLGVAEAADVVAEVVRAMDLRDVVVVMNDVGGALGVGAAIQDPRRYAGLVPVDALGFALDRFWYIRGMLSLLASRAGGWAVRALPIFRWVMAAGGLPMRLSATERATVLSPLADPTSRDRAMRLLAGLHVEADWLRATEAQLGLLQHLPVLTLFGTFDPARLAGFPRRWAELFPHTRHGRLPGGRHFGQEDAPDAVAAQVRAWYADVVEAR